MFNLRSMFFIFSFILTALSGETIVLKNKNKTKISEIKLNISEQTVTVKESKKSFKELFEFYLSISPFCLMFVAGVLYLFDCFKSLYEERRFYNNPLLQECINQTYEEKIEVKEENNIINEANCCQEPKILPEKEEIEPIYNDEYEGVSYNALSILGAGFAAWLKEKGML